MTITNITDVSLVLAVWLVNDDYDYNSEENYISVTGLMKPLRHILIPPRLPQATSELDVQDFAARALGTAIHDSVEKAWVSKYEINMRKLGIPQSVIDRVLINPTDEELSAATDPIPVYLEQREIRDFNGYLIGGKYDTVTEGFVNDTKSTSAYAWTAGVRKEEYQLQGSMYRWLDSARPMPRITEDIMRINFVFTDWQKMQARTNPGYPQNRVAHVDIPLMSLEETEAWITNKLALIERYKNTPEAELPECTPEELWQSDPQYKYYKDPAKTSGRSTRNFTTLADAHSFMAEKGGVGIVITKPGEAKRCEYCPAFEGCTQKDQYL